MKKRALLSSGAAAIAAMVPYAAKAADYDYSYSSDYGTNAASGAAAGGVLAGLLVVWIVVLLAALAFFVFWIIMLIDAFKRTNWQDENQKNLWLIILIVAFFVGFTAIAALLYFFIIKRQLDKKPAVAQSTTETKTDAPANSDKK